MKKKYSIISLMLYIFLTMFFSNCNDNNSSDSPVSKEAGTNSNSIGFENGHVLKGRYSNSDGGIRSFTFYTNGTFERAGASSGELSGGDYTTGSTNSGTYFLSGNTLKVTYQNGENEELPVEVRIWTGKEPEYNSESPKELRIHFVWYANVD